MTLDLVQKDLAFLTENITSPTEQLLMLRSSLELSLIRLGHEQEIVTQAVDIFFQRTLH